MLLRRRVRFRRRPARPSPSPAIAALDRDPGRNCAVASLATEAGCSRSVFAERFQGLTGMPPLRYLAELRMRLASQWIGNGRVPIETVAGSLGYASQAAFTRAFKRVTGHSPGAVRFLSSAAKTRNLNFAASSG